MKTKNKPMIYNVVAENTSTMGAPMGVTIHMSDYFNLYFDDIGAALARCQKHYGKKNGVLKWKRDGKRWTTGDLLWVCYSITPIKINKS